MAKADVLALVDDFLLKADTSGEAEQYYDEVVRELGFREFLTGTRTANVTPPNPQYAIALDTIRVLETHLDAPGRLDPVTGQALRASYGSDWRVRQGTPYHVTRTDQSSNILRLFPIPVDSDTLTVIRTEAPDDVPYWMELAITLEVLSLMFFRQSAARDPDMAATAKQLAGVIWILIGLDLRAFASAATRSGEEG